MKAIIKDIQTQIFNKDSWLIEFEEFAGTLEAICKDNDIELSEDVQLIRKFGVSGKAEIDEETRTVTRLVSTADVDRDRDIIDPDGIILNDFRKNPVVLWAHNHFALPLGKDLWIKKVKNGLMAKTQFASAEANPMAEQVFQLIKEGVLNTSSIGFIPVEMLRAGSQEFTNKIKEISERTGIPKSKFQYAERIFTKVILLEHSDVPVPANPNALNLAVSKGINLDLVKKDIEEYIVLDDPEEKTLEGRIVELENIIKSFVTISDEPNEIALDFDPLIQLPDASEFEPVPKGVTIEEAKDSLDSVLSNVGENLKSIVSKALSEQIDLRVARRQGRVIE